MVVPWFDPERFAGWYALVVGVGLGTLAGVIAVVGGYLAAEEKGRGPILSAMGFFTAMGLISVLLGLVALFGGQPLPIWLTPLLIGLILAGLSWTLLVWLRRAYSEAQARRISKQAARQS
jgi:hypothetical protein